MANNAYISTLDNTILSVRRKPGPAAYALPQCAYTSPSGERCTKLVKRLKSEYCCASHAHMNRPRTTTPKPAPLPRASRASAFITSLED